MIGQTISYYKIVEKPGDEDKVLALAEKEYEDRSAVCVLLKVDPLFDDLRGQPGFLALLKKMGFEK